ncbi:heme A synthase [Chitinibacter sp. GC72]|uniref:COX15/CtaA family protein n=1 Tax=Chitinibacter sp. GC72 TaxID=1526917 RepID=UPI0012FCB879|nr:COX15/CtaA family protein [Chitinibacter sp. GC72]
MNQFSRSLLLLCIAWTAVLMTLGAYVRLEDAGLGCPDWPGCYGHLTVPDEHHELLHAENRFGMPVDIAKGWKEMIHRYVAGGLGLLVLALSLRLARERRQHGQSVWPALLPLVLVLVQGAFGMWTVTLKLMPVVVTAHLIGGMLILMYLLCLAARAMPGWSWPATLRPLWLLAIVLVVLQIVLGGWVSTNYAALACDGFPQCQGRWIVSEGLLEALRPDRALGVSADGLPLMTHHLAAIHWLHRLGALLVSVTLLLLSYRLWPLSARYALLILFALLLQVGLGIANVLLGLPLWLALAHHSGAALLLAILLFGFARYRPQFRAAVVPALSRLASESGIA